MKKLFPLFFAAIILFCAGCATLTPVTSERCTRIVAACASQIDSGKRQPGSITGESIGESGFFYVLSGSGVLLFHPAQVLVGRDFSGVPQVKSILARDSGSQSDELGGASRTVFFRRLASGSMLCLTINTAELQSGSK